MRKYILITILLVISSNSYSASFVPVEINDIKNITIYLHKNQNNKIALTNKEMELFVNEWNTENSKGLCKYVVRIWLVVEEQDGKKREFRINAQSIKENNDYCYRISSDYSKLLYEKFK